MLATEVLDMVPAEIAPGDGREELDGLLERLLSDTFHQARRPAEAILAGGPGAATTKPWRPPC
jgi:hypothetical protein